RRELTEENFDEAYGALIGAYEKLVSGHAYPSLKIAGDSKLYLNPNEDADLNEHADAARNWRDRLAVSDGIQGHLAILPNMGVDLHFWGLGGHMVVFGGSLFAGVGQIQSSLMNLLASHEEHQGVRASKTGSYERRADDWMLQSNLAARELMQIG